VVVDWVVLVVDGGVVVADRDGVVVVGAVPPVLEVVVVGLLPHPGGGVGVFEPSEGVAEQVDTCRPWVRLRTPSL
jgi:hypothetical protein